MGSLFSSPKVPTPPAPPPPSTYVDEVNGVEQVPVTHADGSVTYTTRALPLTPEQQAKKDQLNGILTESLDQIQKLSASDYQTDPETQKILDAWRTTQEKLLGDTYAQRSQQEEQKLAARGLGDSSTAQGVRRQRRLDQQDAEQNLQNQQDELASSVRSDKLALEQQLYSLAASGIDSGQAAAQQAAMKSLSGSISADTARRASILDYYNRTLPSSGYSVFDRSLQSGAGSALGGTIGNLFGGTGRVAGSLLGSLWG